MSCGIAISTPVDLVSLIPVARIDLLAACELQHVLHHLHSYLVSSGKSTSYTYFQFIDDMSRTLQSGLHPLLFKGKIILRNTLPNKMYETMLCMEARRYIVGRANWSKAFGSDCAFPQITF